MTDKQIDLVHALGEHRELIQSCCYELTDLANAAHQLGQDRLGSTLHAMVVALEKSSNDVGAAHSEAVHDTFVRAEQASTNMIRGVLAGIDLGERSTLKAPHHG